LATGQATGIRERKRLGERQEKKCGENSEKRKQKKQAKGSNLNKINLEGSSWVGQDTTYSSELFKIQTWSGLDQNDDWSSIIKVPFIVCIPDLQS